MTGDRNVIGRICENKIGKPFCQYAVVASLFIP